MFAPIVLFTYSRLKNTMETIDSILENKEASMTDLIIYSDAPKNATAIDKVIEVRKYLYTIKGFKSIRIIEREKNYGLAKNIISGITDVLNDYNEVIVLEDDISVSPCFLQYMNEALERYKNREDIVCIHGYMYPHNASLPEAFLIKGADCWSWATWKRGWQLYNENAGDLYNEIVKRGLQKEFEFNYSYPYMTMLKNQAQGTANSWAICWYASAFLNNKYTLYPNKSMSEINSLEDSGTHSVTPSSRLLKYKVEMNVSALDWTKVMDNVECNEGRETFEHFFRSLKTKKRRIVEFVINLFR